MVNADYLAPGEYGMLYTRVPAAVKYQDREFRCVHIDTAELVTDRVTSFMNLHLDTQVGSKLQIHPPAEEPRSVRIGVSKVITATAPDGSRGIQIYKRFSTASLRLGRGP